MTAEDFDYYCDRAGITVSEKPLEQYGLYVLGDRGPEIYIHEDLRGVDRLFTAWHEIAHHWLHPPGVQLFQGWNKAIEIEADIVAACALVPRTLLPHYDASEIVDLYGYSSQLIDLRLEILSRWQI
jgi:Zn-dependent peptidase ImmA (M78 family)